MAQITEQVKLCKGNLHPPGGALVSLSDFTYNKSGPRKDKPLSRCKYCRSTYRTVPPSVFMPLIETLFTEHSLAEVSELVNLNKQQLKMIKEGKRKRINKDTFLSLKRAVDKLPKEKISIGPKNLKSKRNGLSKLSHEERIGLKKLISVAQKKRYKTEKSLLRHVL